MESVRWENHGSHVLCLIGKLYQDMQFIDCTLDTEGGFIKGHTAILAACSPYLKKLFMDNKRIETVPLKEVKYKDMKLILDFIYYGEVVVPVTDVTSLVKTAQLLQIASLKTSLSQDVSGNLPHNITCEQSKCASEVTCEVDPMKNHEGDSSIRGSRETSCQDKLFEKEHNVGFSSENTDCNEEESNALQHVSDGIDDGGEPTDVSILQTRASKALEDDVATPYVSVKIEDPNESGVERNESNLEIQFESICDVSLLEIKAEKSFVSGLNSENVEEFDNEPPLLEPLCVFLKDEPEELEDVDNFQDETDTIHVSNASRVILKEVRVALERISLPGVDPSHQMGIGYDKLDFDETSGFLLRNALTSKEAVRPKNSSREDDSCRRMLQGDSVSDFEIKCEEQLSSHSDENIFLRHPCSSTFTPSCELKQDGRVHSADKPGLCIVNKSPVNKEDVFNTPLQTHAGEKLYICSFCEMSFNKESNLKRHMQRHTKEKLYQCIICEKSFSVNDSLKRHMRSHTGDKQFHCGTCGKSFVQGSHLKRHLLSHAGKKSTHSSVVCEKEAAEEANDAHVSLSHPPGENQLHSGICENASKEQSGFDTNVLSKEKSEQKQSSICENASKEQSDLNTDIVTHSRDKSYHCGVCDQSFKGKSNLTRHMRNHTGERPFQCSICGKAFNVNHTLKKHMATHIGVLKQYHCGICKKLFTMKSYLQVHMRTHTGEKPYQCNTCGKSFSVNDSLKRHLRSHTGEKQYNCETCGKSFVQRDQLRYHMLSHSDEKPYLCNICAKSFKEVYLLNRHIKSHTEDNVHQCTICQKTFSTKTAVKVHMRSHTGERPFLCSVCGKSFSVNDSLKRHMQIHRTVQKHYSCGVCDTSFQDRSSLLCHMKTHSAAKPFLCRVCGMAFIKCKDRRIHFQIHTGEKLYNCTLCDKSYNFQSTLLVHMRSHTGEKPYSCPTCDMSFYCSGARSAHMLKHREVRPHRCSTCGKSYTCRRLLRLHLRKHEIYT